MRRPKDIYDDMPDGELQRRYNKQRLAELEHQGAARHARISRVISDAQASPMVVLPVCPHLL